MKTLPGLYRTHGSFLSLFFFATSMLNIFFFTAVTYLFQMEYCDSFIICAQNIDCGTWF